jgi:hypothetical protein
MAAALVCALALTTTIAQAADALSSWSDGKSKQSIVGFVNSDGHHEMLLWTAARSGARFMGIVHHTDGQRE